MPVEAEAARRHVVEAAQDLAIARAQALVLNERAINTKEGLTRDNSLRRRVSSWARPTNISVILITVNQITLTPIDKARADSIRVKSGGVF